VFGSLPKPFKPDTQTLIQLKLTRFAAKLANKFGLHNQNLLKNFQKEIKNNQKGIYNSKYM